MRRLPCCLRSIKPLGPVGSVGPIRFGQGGFTLVEVIVVMLILGILAALMSTGVANIFQGYLFTRDNSHTALKGQIAMTRITKELRALDGVSTGNRTAVTYSYNLQGSQVTGRILSWDGSAGSPLLLGANILVDGVQDFILSYHTGFNDPGDNTWNGGETLINVTIALQGASDVTTDFSARIAPRNL